MSDTWNRITEIGGLNLVRLKSIQDPNEFLRDFMQVWVQLGFSWGSLWLHFGYMRVALGHLRVTLGSVWASDTYMCGLGGGRKEKG